MQMMTNCTHTQPDQPCTVCELEGQVSAVRACMEAVKRLDNVQRVSVRVRALMNATEHLCKLTEEE